MVCAKLNVVVGTQESEQRILLSYCAKQAGIYELHMSHRDAMLEGSPFAISIAAAEPSPMQSRVTGAATRRVMVGTAFDLCIQPTDEFGNITTCEAAFTLHSTGPAPMLIGSLIRNTDGQYSASLEV